MLTSEYGGNKKNFGNDSIKKVLGSNFKPIKGRWSSCWPSVNELDLGVPTACQVGSAVKLQNKMMIALQTTLIEAIHKWRHYFRNGQKDFNHTN
jgi:hypothetical protein